MRNIVASCLTVPSINGFEQGVCFCFYPSISSAGCIQVALSICQAREISCQQLQRVYNRLVVAVGNKAPAAGIGGLHPISISGYTRNLSRGEPGGSSGVERSRLLAASSALRQVTELAIDFVDPLAESVVYREERRRASVESNSHIVEERSGEQQAQWLSRVGQHGGH